MKNRDHLQELAKIIKQEVWAAYFVGKYYFAVNTNASRTEFGLEHDDDITPDIQKKIQLKNIVALFHEYIHYIHEISTVVGNVSLATDLILKSIFSKYFNPNIENSEHFGLKAMAPDDYDKYSKLYITKNILLGSVETDAKILAVKKLEYINQDIYLLDGDSIVSNNIRIPIFTAETHINSTYRNSKFYLGKFFIYEGLAYELDREFERQGYNLPQIRHHAKGSEYAFLRIIAEYLCPGIDTKSFLTAASLSLSYLDSGSMFVLLLQDLKATINSGNSAEIYLLNKRQAVSAMLFEKLGHFNEAQDEIVEIFKGRKQLYTAFSWIAQQAKNSYMLRAELPTFEIDMVYSKNYHRLFDLVPICDYMYVFNDKDEYNRDFLGTTIEDENIAQSLKALIAYDHYQKAHGLESTLELESSSTVRCPFYTCCNLKLRVDNSEICGNRPWRIFDLSSSTDNQYCWYGQGVGESQGPALY